MRAPVHTRAMLHMHQVWLSARMVQYLFVNVWNDLYAALGFPWTNDEASGRLLVEGHYLPPRAEPMLSGTIEVLAKGIKTVVDKRTGSYKMLGRGETKEDWSGHIGVGDRSRFIVCICTCTLAPVHACTDMHACSQGSTATFDALLTRLSAPKYVGSGPRAKFIFGIIEFEFIGPPPTADEPAASVCKVVTDWVIPKIPEQTKLDSMIKDRYLTGVVSNWDFTTARQATLGLEPPGSVNGQRLLTIKPTVGTRGMGYEQVNKIYSDAHVQGTLSDVDYIEWLAAVRNHQSHHADGRLEEAEFNHASQVVNAFVEGTTHTCLTDAQRDELRTEIKKISC